MYKLNIHELKTRLSELLPEILAGTVIILCRRNVPLAEIRSLPTKPENPRPIGLHKGSLVVPDDFNDPLPKEALGAFYS